MCWECGFDHMAWRRTPVQIVCAICWTPLVEGQPLSPVKQSPNILVPSMTLLSNRSDGLLTWVLPIPYSSVRGTCLDIFTIDIDRGVDD